MVPFPLMFNDHIIKPPLAARESEQRLYALVLSIYLSVCLFVCPFVFCRQYPYQKRDLLKTMSYMGFSNNPFHFDL